MADTFQVELDANEVKLILAAIKMVESTFTIAESQSRAAGEALAEEYEPVQEMYGRLHHKLSGLLREE